MNSLANIATVIAAQIFAATIAGSVLAGLIFLVQLAFGRRLGPGWRHALWLIVLIRLLVPALPESRMSLFNVPRWLAAIESPRHHVTITFLDRSVPDNNLRVPLYSVAPEKSNVALAKRKLTGRETAALIWWIVALGLIARVALASLWLCARLSRSPVYLDSRVIRTLSEARWQIRTLWNPRPVEARFITSPGLFGLLRPRILLPSGISTQLSETELRHIFLHEIAHLKRGDLWVNLLMSIAHALHWFNPVVWFVLRRLRLERELACDALALRAARDADAKLYGETILKLLERITPRAVLTPVVGILEEKHSAVMRLSQIAQFSCKRTTSHALGIVVLLAIAVTGLSNAQTEKQRPELPETTGASETRSTTRGVEILSNEFEKQKAVVDEQRSALDALRAQHLRSGEFAELNIESEISQARARLIEYERRRTSLRGMTRAKLRQVIPSVAPDAAMDRYLGNLGEAEQQYAAKVSELGPEHPEIVQLKHRMARINQQIEDRIDGILAGLDVQVEAAVGVVQELEKRAKTVNPNRLSGSDNFDVSLREQALATEEQKLDTISRRLLTEKIDTAPRSGPLVEDARLLLELGKLDEAETKLKGAIKADPNDNAARSYLRVIKDRESAGKLAQDIERTRPTPAQSQDRSAGSAADTGLYTRSYRIPRELRWSLESELRGVIDFSESFRKAISDYFDGQRSSQVLLSNEAPPSAPAPAIAYDGIHEAFFVRATLADLDKVEKMAQRVISSKSPQLMIDTHIVELKPGAAYEQDLLLRTLATNVVGGFSTIAHMTDKTHSHDVRSSRAKNSLSMEVSGQADSSILSSNVVFTGALEPAQFKSVLRAFEKRDGVDVYSEPKITTLSGRAGRLSVEPGPVVEFLPVIQPDGETVKIDTSFEIPVDPKKGAQGIKATSSALIKDGQTAFFLPERGDQRPQLVVFVTVQLVDEAGKPIH